MTDEELLRELVAERATGFPKPPEELAEVKQRRLLRLDRAMRRSHPDRSSVEKGQS